MTYSDAAVRPEIGSTQQNGAWLVPVIGGGILTLLWGVYTVLYIAHIAMIPLR